MLQLTSHFHISPGYRNPMLVLPTTRSHEFPGLYLASAREEVSTCSSDQMIPFPKMSFFGTPTCGLEEEFSLMILPLLTQLILRRLDVKNGLNEFGQWSKLHRRVTYYISQHRLNAVKMILNLRGFKQQFYFFTGSLTKVCW